MKVGIDTFGCEHGRSGIGSYLISLIKNLPSEADLQYELFGHDMDKYTFDPDSGKTSFSGVQVTDSSTADRLWHLFRLNTFIKKNGYDVILFPSGSRVLPLRSAVPSVAVISEIISDTLKKTDDIFLKQTMMYRLKKVTKIIAASQFIRKDLINLGINPEKIIVIHNGIDHSHFYQRPQIDGTTVTVKPFSIKRPYFIYASRIQSPQKKHIELIRAFSLFKKKTGLPHRLVLAGSDGQNAEAVHREAASCEYASDIFLTGYFPHNSLPELYSCADACIFPASSEGVGLPVIEAMASGIPSACAKAGSLPEIAGDNALFFNPDNVEEMSQIMEQIITDNKLRKKLAENGLEWTKRFSWQKTAHKTVEVLRMIAKQ